MCAEGCGIQGVDGVGEAPDQTHKESLLGGESQGVDGVDQTLVESENQGLQEVLIEGETDWVEQAPVGSGVGEALVGGGNQALEEGESLGVVEVEQALVGSEVTQGVGEALMEIVVGGEKQGVVGWDKCTMEEKIMGLMGWRKHW